jgi:uncharacterized membrane protein YhaH (DUF805 family)
MEKYFSFSGRIRRTHYVLRIILGNTVACLSGFAFGGSGSATALSLIVVFVVLFAVTWFNLAAAVQRCHDMDKSGWYCIIPIYGPIIMFFVEGTMGSNQYGDDPKRTKYVVSPAMSPQTIVSPTIPVQAPQKKDPSGTGYQGGYVDPINKIEAGYEDIGAINDYFGIADQQGTTNSQQPLPVMAPASQSAVNNTSSVAPGGRYKKGSLYK